MKIKYLVSLFAVLSLFSCQKEEEPEFKPVQSGYVGIVTVTYQGSDFDNDDIMVYFTPSDDGQTASITIHKIRFVPQMPVTIDVTIPDVSMKTNGTEALLSCDNVVPQAMGGDYPRYLVTGLTGKVTGSGLSFSLKFGDFPTSFTGTLAE